MPPVSSADRATAYYHYTLGHMYAELAGNTTNRNDYVNLAIENYKAAIKADPSSALMAEELSDLYSQSGRMRDGQTDAEQAIKTEPQRSGGASRPGAHLRAPNRRAARPRQ